MVRTPSGKIIRATDMNCTFAIGVDGKIGQATLTFVHAVCDGEDLVQKGVSRLGADNVPEELQARFAQLVGEMYELKENLDQLGIVYEIVS